MDKKIKGKIKKTDKAVKTVESWWALGQAVWNARNVLLWAGGAVIGLGALIMTALVNIYTLGWPYWILISIPAFFFSALLWLAISWIWHLRPQSLRRAKIPPKKIDANIVLLEDAKDSSKKKDHQGLKSGLHHEIDPKLLDRISKLESVISAMSRAMKMESHIKTFDIYLTRYEVAYTSLTNAAQSIKVDTDNRDAQDIWERRVTHQMSEFKDCAQRLADHAKEAFDENINFYQENLTQNDPHAFINDALIVNLPRSEWQRTMRVTLAIYETNKGKIKQLRLRFQKDLNQCNNKALQLSGFAEYER